MRDCSMKVHCHCPDRHPPDRYDTIIINLIVVEFS